MERVEESKDWQALLKTAVAQFRNSDEFVGTDSFDSPRFISVAKQLLHDASAPAVFQPKKLKPISAFVNKSPTRPIASTSAFRAARTPSSTKPRRVEAPIVVRKDEEDHSMLSDQEFEETWESCTLGGLMNF